MPTTITRQRAARFAVGFVLIALVGFLLLLPFWVAYSRAESRKQSKANLEQLIRAILSYHDDHKKLPTPAIYDLKKKDGKPLLSWRVAMLPFLGQKELYDRFHLDEPWDSEHNIKLLREMPDVYAPSATSTAGPYATFYQLIVGPSTAFERSTSAPWEDPWYTLDTNPDGLSTTIAMVEATVPVPWTKPDDLTYDPNGPLPRMGGTLDHDGRFHVALFDGSVRLVRRSEVLEETLRNAIRCADNGSKGLNEKERHVNAQKLAKILAAAPEMELSGGSGITVVRDEDTRREIVWAIEKSVARGTNDFLCHNPRHFLYFTSGGSEYKFSICFECLNMIVYADGKDLYGYLPISRAAEKTLNDVLNKAGIPSPK